jgi:hypothetical protein
MESIVYQFCEWTEILLDNKRDDVHLVVGFEVCKPSTHRAGNKPLILTQISFRYFPTYFPNARDLPDSLIQPILLFRTKLAAFKLRMRGQRRCIGHWLLVV